MDGVAVSEMLVGLTDQDLRQLLARTARGRENLLEALGDLESERVGLEAEAAHLHDTIALTMREVKKLDFRGGGVEDPRLDEGLLGLMGRIWEKAAGAPARGGGGGTARPPSVGSLVAYLRAPGRPQDLGADSAGPDGADEGERQLPQQQQQEGAPCDARGEEVGGQAQDGSPVREALAEGPRPEGSTLLVEAQVRLGDGSVQVVQVRAEDRCKEVAARFVQEHSLKAWFEAPLEAFLLQAEAGAARFPVRIEADLLEIRQQYSAQRT